MSYHYTGATFSGLIQCLLYYLVSNVLFVMVTFVVHKNLFTFSLSVSNADVASSSNSIFGFLTRARAMAIRCFCPPDS